MLAAKSAASRRRTAFRSSGVASGADPQARQTGRRRNVSTVRKHSTQRRRGGAPGSGGTLSIGCASIDHALSVSQRETTPYKRRDGHRSPLPAPGVRLCDFLLDKRQRPRYGAAEDTRQLRAQGIRSGSTWTAPSPIRLATGSVSAISRLCSVFCLHGIRKSMTRATATACSPSRDRSTAPASEASAGASCNTERPRHGIDGLGVRRQCSTRAAGYVAVVVPSGTPTSN